MCRERLAFGGTHPPGLSGVCATEYKFPFRGSCLRTQVSLSWRDELQRHGPGELRETVSRNASIAGRPLFWGTTTIERGRVNYSSINGPGMKIPISAL